MLEALFIVSGAIGFAILAWGLYLAISSHDRRAVPDRRIHLRAESPGRRLSDLITMPPVQTRVRHDRLNRAA